MINFQLMTDNLIKRVQSLDAQLRLAKARIKELEVQLQRAIDGENKMGDTVIRLRRELRQLELDHARSE